VSAAVSVVGSISRPWPTAFFQMITDRFHGLRSESVILFEFQQVPGFTASLASDIFANENVT